MFESVNGEHGCHRKDKKKVKKDFASFLNQTKVEKFPGKVKRSSSLQLLPFGRSHIFDKLNRKKTK